jgi:hypothetical protein
MAKEQRQVLQKQARQDNISKLRQLIEKGKETRNSENQEIEEEKWHRVSGWERERRRKKRSN